MISILMSTYNREKLLPRAIDSVLNQTYKNFELIICDDCSSDNSYKLLENYKNKHSNIKIIKNDNNMGLTKSLNKLLEHVSGSFIARLDSDDYYHPEKLEKQIKFLKINKDIDFVGTMGQTIDYDGKFITNNYIDNVIPSGNKNTIKKIMSVAGKNCIIAGSPLYHKYIFDKIGKYDEIMYTAQDYNIHLRMLQFFNYDLLKEKLYFYTQCINNENNSVQKSKKSTEFYRKYGARAVLGYKRAKQYPIIK